MSEQPTIQVSEQLSDRVQASAAILHVTISDSRLFSGNAALREAEAVRVLIESFEEIGLPANAVSLEGVRIDVAKGLIVKSSSATYRVAVRCADLEKLPELLDVMTRQKKCSLNDIEWDYEQAAAAKRPSWLRTCVERAGRKAEALAEALGVSVVGLGELRETTYRRPVAIGGHELSMAAPGSGLRRRASIAGELAGLELAPTEQFSVQIEVTYRVEPKHRG